MVAAIITVGGALVIAVGGGGWAMAARLGELRQEVKDLRQDMHEVRDRLWKLESGRSIR